MIRRIWTPLPLALGVVLAVVYAVHHPLSPDLAAQTARGELFDRVGYVPYWERWYAGVPTGGYSLTTPPLLGWWGPAVCSALALVATAALARPLLRDARRPTLGAIALVGTAWMNVLAGRTTFAVGVAVGIGAMLAAERRHNLTAAMLGLLAWVTSPVAGLLLLIPAGVYVLADRERRRSGVALGVGALAGAALLSVLRFNAHGMEPFADFVLRPCLLVALGVAILPVGRRVRAGALLTALATLLAYSVHTPVGSNVTRAVLLGAIPAVVAACRLPLPITAVAAVAIGWWPVSQLSIDLGAARSVSSQPAYTAGLVDRLRNEPLLTDRRIEIVDTATHWASARVARVATLARGWERQTDEARNALFYGSRPLDASAYASWLHDNAVALVAVPKGARIDFGAAKEATLIADGVPYLHLVWSDEHWSLYAVDAPGPTASGAGELVRFTETGVVVHADAPGAVSVAMTWSAYLTVDGGAHLTRTHDGRVTLDAPGSGTYTIHGVWRWPW